MIDELGPGFADGRATVAMWRSGGPSNEPTVPYVYDLIVLPSPIGVPMHRRYSGKKKSGFPDGRTARTPVSQGRTSIFRARRFQVSIYQYWAAPNWQIVAPGGTALSAPNGLPYGRIVPRPGGSPSAGIDRDGSDKLYEARATMGTRWVDKGLI